MKKNLHLLLVIIAIITLPKFGSAQLLSESFEGATFPPTGWLLVNNGTGNNWTLNTNAAKSSDGINSMRYALSPNPADAWAFTKALSLTAGTTYTLTFDYKVQSATKPEKLKITVGNAQTVASQTTVLWDNAGGSNLTNTTFTQATIQFTPTNSGTYYYAFNCYSDANKKRIWVDKVVITAPSTSCADPSNQTETSLTSTSAQLNWTSGGANDFNVEYGPTGFTPGTGTSITVATDTFTVLSNLTAGTTYDWYVQDSCGVGDVSNWVGPHSFTTNCGIYSANYTQDFSSYIPNCWSEAKGLLETNTTFNDSVSSLWTGDGFANNGNTGAARVRIKKQNRSWLISPSIDLSTGNYQLEFDMALTAPGSTADTTLGIDDSVVVVISTDNGATWNKANKLKVWTANDSISNVGEHQIINLSAYNSVVKIAFYTPSNITNTETEFFIDNFAITPNTNISVDLGNDTAICEGSTFTLNSGSPASYSHLWTANGDTLTATTPSITVDSAAIYTVEVSNGVNTAYDTLVLSVNALPTVSASPLSASICEGDSVQVTAQFTGAAPWNFNVSANGTVFADSSSTATYQVYTNPLVNTSYTIVSITDANGCTQTAHSDTLVVTVNPNPTVSLSSLNDLCANSTDVVLTGGTPANGTYTGVGVNTATGSFSATTAGVGNHTITYHYTDGNGCVDSATATQTVNDIPNITVSASSNPVPYNTSTNLTASVSNAVGSLIYSWTPTASISGSATMASVTTINITNSTNFIVNITDNGTSCSNNDSIMITYSGGPITVSPIATPSSVCVGDTASLMAQGSGGSGTLTYTWTSNPSGFTASGENVDAVPSQDTWYFVQATDGANTATDSVFVSVNALPGIVSVTSGSICLGDSALVSIVFSGSAPYTFTGTENGQVFNAASPSDSLNHYLSPMVTTTYVLTSLTDNNGCTISGNLDSITVLVHNLPTVTYSGSDTICMGESVNAVATFTGAAPFDYIYNGVSVTGVNAMSDTQVLTPTSDSTFVISSVVDANGCSITGNLDSVFVKVNALPMVDLGNDTTVCINHSIVLDAGAGYASYLWSTGATTQSISLDSLDFNLGSNDYSVMVTNAANCSNSDTITLTVDPCTGILVPILEGTNIAVFPNPSKGQFQLKLSGLQNQKYDLEIYNSVGSKVYSEAVDGNGQDVATLKLDFSSMAKGVYFIRLQSNNKIKVKRLIIQ